MPKTPHVVAESAATAEAETAQTMAPKVTAANSGGCCSDDSTTDGCCSDDSTTGLKILTAPASTSVDVGYCADGVCVIGPTAAAESGDAQPSGEEAHHGYHSNKQAHLLRLRRIEGQIRGLQKMVDEDKYCIDILTQVSAATKALESVALNLLDEHLNHCVRNAAQAGGKVADEKIAEASQAIARLVRS